MAGYPARLALEPGEGAARVDHHSIGGGRGAKGDLGYVVPHAQGGPWGQRGGEASGRREGGRFVFAFVVETGGEGSDAVVVMAENGGEREVGREGGRGAGAAGVVKGQMDAFARNRFVIICCSRNE